MIDRTANLHRRYVRERRFVRASAACAVSAVLFLGFLLTDVIWQGWRGFLSASMQLHVFIDPQTVGAEGKASVLRYQKLVQKSLHERFSNVTARQDKKQLKQLASFGGGIKLHSMVQKNPSLIGERLAVWLPASAIAEAYLKGGTDTDLPENQRNISDQQIAWLDELRDASSTRIEFNTRFFTAADSRDPELSGIAGALRGTFFTLLLAFLLAFPAGVMTAIYLEIFAPRNRWFDLIEININNLAAVPSVIFGLLGLAIFINLFGIPRSSSLVGGMVLSLMTLPTIIITARAALRAVPPSLLFGALSLGATKMQGVFHHVLPAAMPGILTGAIIGMAQALGETAPLLMIGMVAFIANAPDGITDAATALPVQIFLWADSPERGFVERTAAAIVTLLGFLVLMNASAVILRKRLEIKW
ncbi:phosphate ABC transporter permease PstA [Candidatus Persebacteraceae bacterium Df01]|jgi:phosphate transport system permease protein|uniref:Phosphate transport system permease protein PstA n=1 Tax=Candidatus Doriopsillibacter californiensis TaxID=2970740 RepID=A0ABT7QLF1_9GAMM|nr:phosphate ABC transporter permease PstA [Candidatus Persebacteraceae bacterium Df01]